MEGVSVCVCGYVYSEELLNYSEKRSMRTNPYNVFPWGVRRKRRKVLWGKVKGQQAADKHIHRNRKAYTKGIYMPKLARERSQSERESERERRGGEEG